MLSMEYSLPSSLDTVMSAFDEEPANPKIYPNNDAEKILLKRMYECYKEGKLCDVTLVVGNINEIKTHRLVLSSCSLFFDRLFNGNWNDCEQGRHKVRGDFAESTIRCMLDFVYTGKLQLNSRNVLRILYACDYYQFFELDFIKESVADYLKERVNENNCPSLLNIAQRLDAMKLEELLIKYAARNFFRVAQSEDFIKLPVELLVKILQSEMLVVDYDRPFLPLSAEQEKFIIDFLVERYIPHQSENGQQSDLLLSKLVYCIRFHCLSLSSLDKLCGYARNGNYRKSLELITEAREEVESNDDPGLIRLWGTEREASKSIENYCNVHAGNVMVGPVQSTFGDGACIGQSLLFIQGMEIWIRLWDNHPVIGGLNVFYSNGESHMYGGHDEDSTFHYFHLGKGERIVKAIVRSGFMIDSLKFITNKGQELGPYGGGGGREYTEEPRGEYGFLSYISGSVVKTQEKLGITKLRLNWKEFPLFWTNSGSTFSKSGGNE